MSGKKARFFSVVLAAALLLLPVACVPSRVEITPVPGPEVGRPAPDFSWSADDGTKETLGDLKGKVVILVFWSPTCEYCREELKTLESIHRDYSEEVVIVGVSRSLGGGRSLRS